MTSNLTDYETVGLQLHELATRLYPICRSNSGDGIRDTLTILNEIIPLKVHEVPTGTKVFDWEVPQEWNIRDAYIRDKDGVKVVDFQNSNLHVVNGSLPISQSMPWSKLKPHLHTLPEQPDLIPFRTNFSKRDWGFCLSQNVYDQLDAAGEQTYEVVVDSKLCDGYLTYGECYLPGKVEDEVLFSSHICHPSLANDNLSGLTIAGRLGHWLSTLPDRHYSYRFVFAPATIGAITWLAQNVGHLGRIKHGLILSLLGDSGHSTYKRSRFESATIDRVVEHVLSVSGQDFDIRNFAPYGYDERQYCSPGINLPMGCLMRTPDGEFPEYHTSADNLDFIKPAALADSFGKCVNIVEILENNKTFINLHPQCEPRLGRHGLYESLPADADRAQFQHAVQWVLNLSDGHHSLFDIAARSHMDFSVLADAAQQLAQCKLITEQR